LITSAAALSETAFCPLAWAVPKPYSWEAMPPNTNGDAFVQWMVANRGENPHFLGQRFSRYQTLVANRDVLDDRNKRAFLLTPREEFTLKHNQGRAYDHAYLDIGFGVTISGPHVVSRMTSTVDVKMGEKVLEIGTGSGYQAAYLANLTDKVWTVEIIKPLAERTRDVYDALLPAPHRSTRRSPARMPTANTAGRRRGPSTGSSSPAASTTSPALLQQLGIGSVMVIPVGPPAPSGCSRSSRSRQPTAP
jgi:protein-L-isoaspartate(D-aspartate) O-methyltransferase